MHSCVVCTFGPKCRDLSTAKKLLVGIYWVKMGEQVGGGLPGDELLVSIVITHALNHKAKNKPFLK